MESFSNRIRTSYRNNVLPLRLKGGFERQKDFAKKLGLSPTVLCEIESGKRFLSAIVALRISEVLRCNLDDLYERKIGAPLTLDEAA